MHSPDPHIKPAPRIPLAIVGALLPGAERDEVIAALSAEYTTRAGVHGSAAARRWLWRQAFHSLPALLRWTAWRGSTGYEPRSSAFRPRGPIVKTWRTDARYAARRLRARPGYTLLAVLTLALGIGGTAAVFGLARPLILDPLPYANADEAGAFWMPGWWTEEEFLFLRGKFSGFRDVAAYRPGDATMRDGDAPARLVPGIQASAELFDVLGARPLLGRVLQRGDDARGAEPVAVVSYGLWQELGGSPSIIGKRITLDGSPRTIVGVMPSRFWFPTPDIRIWHAKPLDPQGRNGSYALVGRVQPGIDVHALEPQIKQLTSIMGERFQYSAQADKTKNAVIKPLRDDLLGAMRPALVATFVAMGLILLIACTNVAALMLGQVEGRATELAVRSALGATRGRMTQQLIIEALVLGALAGLVGAGFAAAGFHLLARALPLGAWSDSATFDWTMFGAALAIAMAAVLLVVLVPAASLWRGNLRDALNGGRTGGIRGRGGRMERGLVVAEVALAMIIATGAALLVRSVANRYAIDPGVETKGISVIDVVASADLAPRQRVQSINDATAALARLPGVRSVAATMKLPMRGNGNSFGITVEGREDRERSFTFFRIVTRQYFETLGITIRSGRVFDTSDRPDSTEVPVVINDALAQKYFPGENPIGRRMGGGFSIPQRVIGVVANVAEGELNAVAVPARYYLVDQVPLFISSVAFAIRTARPVDAEALLDAERQTIQRVAPGFALQGTTTMQRVFDKAVGPARQVMSLLALLSGLALLLGGIGIYGVISHFATRRRRDWAIRVALGLPASDVLTHIVRQGLTLAIIGIFVGAIGAMAVTRLLASFLFGVSGVDPVAFASASALLLVIGAGAAFIPARRAATVDPALVLREQ
ncbi:MAG: ADOP family duplicated permease [bacterium]